MFRHIRVWAAVAAVGLVLGALAGLRFADRIFAWVYSIQDQPPQATSRDIAGESGLVSTPYLSAQGNVAYKGSEACTECHAEEHQSCRHTGMGRSMASVDLAREP